MPPSCTERQDFNHWWLLETTWPFCCLLSFCQALCHIGVRFYLRLLINCLYHVWIDTGITSGIILTLVWHFLSFFGQVPWPCRTASTVPSLGLIRSYGKSPNTSAGTQVMVPLMDFIPPPGFVLIHMKGRRADTSLASRFVRPVSSGLRGKWWKPTWFAAEVGGILPWPTYLRHVTQM